MNKTQIKRLLSILDFFAGLFFGIALLGGYLAFQMTYPLIASILSAIVVFGIFTFLMILTRYFIAKISLASRHNELLEKIIEGQELRENE